MPTADWTSDGWALTSAGGDSAADPTTGETAPITIDNTYGDLAANFGHVQCNVDIAVGAPVAKPDTWTHHVGDTFTVTVPVTNQQRRRQEDHGRAGSRGSRTGPSRRRRSRRRRRARRIWRGPVCRRSCRW
jgi:hypothetical protein